MLDAAPLDLVTRLALGETLATLGRFGCLLYTSDAADERSSVDLGGRRIIKKKKKAEKAGRVCHETHKSEDAYEGGDARKQ